MAWFGLGTCTNTPESTRAPLEAGRPQRLDLAQDTVTFIVSAQAGDYVRIEVEQRGVDVTLRLRGPDGAELARGRRAAGRVGTELVEAETATAGACSLEIEPRYPALDHGAVQVTLVALRPPTATDERRLVATQALRHGAELARARQWSEASHELELGVNAWRELGDEPQELYGLLLLAQVYFDADRYDDALASYPRATELATAVGSDSAMSRILRGQGNAHLFMGDLLLALAEYERSTALAERCGDRAGIPGSRMNAGLVHYRLGEPEDALDDLRAATRGFAALGDEFGLSHTYRGVAEAYMALGDSVRAREALDQGLEVATDFPRNRAGLLRELGRLWLDHLGDPNRALAAFAESAELFRDARADTHLAEVLHLRGLAYEASGDLDHAAADQEEALRIQQEAGARSMIADTLRGLGRVAAARGRWARARDLFARSAAEQEALHRVPALVEVLDDWARAELAAGRVAAARATSERAVRLTESIRAEVERLDLLTTFGGTTRAVFDTAVDVALRAPGSAEVRAAASFAAAERGRTRALVEMLALAPRGGALGSPDPEIRAGLDQARRTLRQDMLELRQELEGARGEADVRALERSVAESIDAYEAQRSRALRADRAAWWHGPPRLAEVRAAIGERAALLAYSLREPESTVWVLSGESLSVNALPGRATIEAAARRLHASLTARTREPGRDSWDGPDAETIARARSLADTILPRLPPGLERLYVVADGALHLVPFALLPRDGEPLVSSTAVVYTPSAAALVLLSGRRRALGSAAQVTVLADPVFNASDPRLRSRQAAPEESKAPSFALRAAESAGLHFGRLRFSRREAEVIHEVAPEARVYLDFRATPENLAAATGSDILHVASHAVLNTERPELSGLVLSLFDKRAEPVDGFVRLHDLYDLRLPGALVVLSACQTALGRQVRGEGVVGLSRGFMFAGARAVVSSLWQVDDRATAELMRHFYDALLERHEPPAVALRSAQLAMQKSDRWRAPFYWAGFVPQGS